MEGRMRGTEVVAKALRTCADTFYTVPGYPVTEIAEILHAELVINEKVALEYALGDSIAGRRSVLIIKNVGLNVCADPLVNATTQGLRSGVVIIAGDDVLAKGSQNTQDSRYYGEVAQVPVIEPNKINCVSAIASAFEASEHFSRVVIVRVTPQLLENEAVMGACKRQGVQGKLADPNLTMRGRSQAAEKLTSAMFEWSRSSPLNDFKGGVVGVGATEGDSHVATVYPPPAKTATLARTNELGRSFVHEHRCIKAQNFKDKPETYTKRGHYRTFCRECPFKPLIQKLVDRKMSVICDMGCSVLATNPPYRIGVACYALGSSIAVAARSTQVALIGDYALLHSGINALIDVYEKHRPLLCIVLKNDRMGMTGGQEIYDLLRYLTWAKPVVCRADNERNLNKELVVTKTPRTLIVEGMCPKGCNHETVEC